MWRRGDPSKLSVMISFHASIDPFDKNLCSKYHTELHDERFSTFNDDETIYPD